MDVNTIITIIGCVIGGGGISALITTFISMRKSKAEANVIEQEAVTIKTTNDIAIMDYVNKLLKESEKNANDIARETRQENEALREQIDELNRRLQALMNWIVTDNYRYRSSLETEIKKLNPNVVLPTCPPAPNVFSKEHD